MRKRDTSTLGATGWWLLKNHRGERSFIPMAIHTSTDDAFVGWTYDATDIMFWMLNGTLPSQRIHPK